MDSCHLRLGVYGDADAPENHFPAFGKIPDPNAAVDMDTAATNVKWDGATSIRCSFDAGGATPFGGYYFLNGVLSGSERQPELNFGTVPDAGLDATGATMLVFHARGEKGGEQIDFFVGGVGLAGQPVPYPDSSDAVHRTFTLTKSWRPYAISLRGHDLHYLLGGFGWVADKNRNSSGATFYLDRIEIRLGGHALAERLNQPRFLRSYSTLGRQPDTDDTNLDDDIDVVLRKVAFSYDNALAILAFLADHRSKDSLRRARLIGDAFVHAATHDRTFTDGRIRTAYAAGDPWLPPGWIPNGKVETATIPGFYNRARQLFLEVQQSSCDVGNNAWVGIALLALHARTGEGSYLQAALNIGQFIRNFRNTTGTYQGFQGGLDNPEDPSPVLRPWASSEHNLDCYAFFKSLAAATSDSTWQDDALHAQAFVEAMFDSSKGLYLAGTADPGNRNAAVGQLPVDVQAWSTLALPDALQNHPALFQTVENSHATVADGVAGFDFNDDKDVVWFEGTAQMAAAYQFHHGDKRAATLRRTLQLSQLRPPFGDGLGIAAASHDAASTGFGFKLFRRPHVGATCWLLFSMLRFNPYYQTFA